MKIKELLYKTPEMTEEKLLELIKEDLKLFRARTGYLSNRIQQIYNYSDSLDKLFLKEFDTIQDKKSYLTKSERDLVTGFVGLCMIKMTKGNG